MKASQFIIWGLVAVVGYMVLRGSGLLASLGMAPQPLTARTSTGSTSVVPKDDFQSATDAITAIFNTVGKFAGTSGQAQTAPKTLSA